MLELAGWSVQDMKDLAAEHEEFPELLLESGDLLLVGGNRKVRSSPSQLSRGSADFNLSG
jgi:hypothetical protein